MPCEEETVQVHHVGAFGVNDCVVEEAIDGSGVLLLIKARRLLPHAVDGIGEGLPLLGSQLVKVASYLDFVWRALVVIAPRGSSKGS